jgi:2-dehydropantoate 2-reductase
MILIVGAGAVGTVLATYLSVAGKEPVHLFMRDKDRAEMAAAQQVRVDTIDGKTLIHRPKPILVDTLDLTGVDYLFLCVKFADLLPLLDQLPVAADFPSSCTIVSTLNGIEPLRVLKRRLPNVRTTPISIMYNAQLLGVLHARITTKPIVVLSGDDLRLKSAFGVAGSTADTGIKVLQAQGESAVWGKLLINLANAVCALTHTTFEDLFTRAEMRHIYVAVLDEAVSLLARAGIAYQLPMPVTYAIYRWMLLYAGPLSWWIAQRKNGVRSGSYPSMVADVEKGRVTEVTQLNGEVVRLGVQHQVKTPVASKIVALVEGMAGQAPPVYLTPLQLELALGL